MKIQHVIHHHPLSFIEQGNTMRWCEGCGEYLMGPTYGCRYCPYFLHKSCLDEHKAELSCTFRAHVECALKQVVEYSDEEYTIQHFTHLHPLKLVDSNQKDEVICSICEELCLSSSSSSSNSTFGCMECKFFLHKSCMKSIPRQLINHRIHPCTLIFITFPFWDECDCCGERIVSHMRFSCGACDLNLHVKCALFPTIDSEDAKEIQHFSHPHTLALVQNNEEYGSEPRCVACAQICLPPAPTFRCSRSCNHFFLHKSCYVKLPYKSINFKHPFHPKHPLTIKSLPYNDHIRTCDACFRGIDSALLAYSCQKPECKFNLHLDCYNQLSSITFRGHQHLLALLEKTPDVTCHLCGVNYRNFVLRCVPCDINIHFQCHPSAPETIKHKSHLHPLTLTKSPFEFELNLDEEEEEFYCDVCEQKRNQRELIYYCAECKFIAEVKCVFSAVSISCIK
ncbi:DNA repair RAD50 [Gossypium arboreum]|uniref:DNA repair RAD50 n=1 Tax=Gossypium arboreum TaxID=29729 RepID=A0A0B0NY06_GOSAR|nr:DNA repair RAD50 [Gossypium arboreum]